jgi:hypothetical protein
MEDGADFMRCGFLGMMLLDQHDSGAAHFLPGAADFAAGREAKKSRRSLPTAGKRVFGEIPRRK